MQEKTDDVLCNWCEWTGTDQDLPLMQDESGDPFKGCPHCKTDAFLMDIDP